MTQGAPAQDLGQLVEENQRLVREVRQLRERVAAFEASRWWRLHPRNPLRRSRPTTAESESADAGTAHAFPIDFDDVDRELCGRVAPFTMTTPARIYALARAIEYVVANRIAGSIVECGVWRGGSMLAVALTLQRLGSEDRDLYLYDTFAGMTEPGEEDVMHTGQSAAALLADDAPSHYRAAASLEDVQETMREAGYPEERIHFVRGPVEETLPREAPEEIALLRLDTDWYASTKHELVHLYPRLAPGGVLIVDDYAYWLGARKAVDEFLAENGDPLLLHRIDYTARIAVRPPTAS